jgi:hypothetical protein
MKYAIEMSSGDIAYITFFIKVGRDVRNLNVRDRYTHTERKVRSVGL